MFAGKIICGFKRMKDCVLKHATNQYRFSSLQLHELADSFEITAVKLYSKAKKMRCRFIKCLVEIMCFIVSISRYQNNTC